MTPNISPEDRAALADELERALNNLHAANGRQLDSAESDLMNVVVGDASRILAALRAAPAVPREPTEAMVQAGYNEYSDSAYVIDQLPEIWRAMYDAAPGALHE